MVNGDIYCHKIEVVETIKISCKNSARHGASHSTRAGEKYGVRMQTGTLFQENGPGQKGTMKLKKSYNTTTPILLPRQN